MMSPCIIVRLSFVLDPKSDRVTLRPLTAPSLSSLPRPLQDSNQDGEEAGEEEDDDG